MYIGFVGAFVFILIQLILIIDFAHSWAEAWVGNYEETDSKGWLAALLSATGAMYACSLTAVVLFYVYYTGESAGQCKLHEFFISFNMVRTNLVFYLFFRQVLVHLADPVHRHERGVDPAPDPGAHAQVGPPPVRSHHALHHVPHLVRHVQQPVSRKIADYNKNKTKTLF